MINNNSGLITIDYLFALVLVAGFTFIIFALSMTLTMTEVVQYITFSSARNYYAGHIESEEQRTQAILKFNELTNNGVVSPLLNSGWFSLDRSRMAIDTNIPEKKSDLSDYQQEPDRNLFHGTVVWFTANILEFNLPFYGSTVNDDLRGGNEFGAYIGSYLGREVTHEECENFLVNRWDFFQRLSTGGASQYSEARDGERFYVAIADNGC